MKTIDKWIILVTALASLPQELGRELALKKVRYTIEHR
jgi:hypothetical protein